MAADDAAVVVTLRADLKQYVSALKTAVRQTERAAQAAEKAVSGVGKNARPDFRGMNDNFRRATRQMENDARASQSRVQRIFSGFGAGPRLGGGLLGGVVAGVSLGGAQDLLDSATRIKNALRVAGLEGGQLSQTFSDLAKIAKENGASFEDLAKLYSRVSQSQKELGLSSSQVLDFTSKIAVALKAAGTDSASASAGIQQLTQALASGVLRGDEFNSIMENLPTVARAIAAGLGVPIGELRKMAEAGELTATTVVAAFEKGFGDIADQASKADTTISAAFENLKTTLIEAAVKFDAATGASKEFAEFLSEDLTKAINDIVKVFAVLGESGIGAFIRDLDAARVRGENAMRALGRGLGINFMEGWGATVSGQDALDALGRVFADFGSAAPFQAGPQRISDQATDKEIREFVRGRIKGMIQQESGGSATAANPDSSARGLGQFIESTWLRLFPKVFPGLAGGASREQQLAFRFDPNISRKMTEELAVENVKAMREAGTVIVDGAVYLAHFLGSEGAKKVLQAAPGTPVSQLGLGAGALGANKGVFAKHPTAGSLIEWAAGIEGGTKAAKEAKLTYDELVATMRDKMAAQERENAINADSTKSTDDKSAALAREKAAQEAATVAKQLDAATLAQNGVLTDADKERNRQLAEQYAATGLKAEELSLRTERLAESNRLAAAETEKLKDAQIRARQALAETLASMATNAVTGFVQDLRNGVSAAEALYNVVSRIADQLLQMALQAAFRNLFGSLLGVPMGGGLLGMASGGYTGDRPTRAPAGVVHGQEFVINAQATRKHRDLLEAINRGAPGYASGGFVLPRMSAMQMLPSQQAAAPQVNSRTTVVNTFDSGSFLSEALSRPDGVNVILNAVRAQPGAFRQAMNG